MLVGIIFFIVHAAIDSRSIVDSAMAPEFQPGQFVLVNKIAYLFAGPSRGEVVLFADPRNPKQDPRMGRIIGVPGDTVSVTPTSVVVNGVTLNEPYTQLVPGSTQNSVVDSRKLGQTNIMCCWTAGSAPTPTIRAALARCRAAIILARRWPSSGR